MKKRTSLVRPVLGGLLLTALALVVSSPYWWATRPVPEKVVFPERDAALVLKPATWGESMRYVRYYPGTKEPQVMRIEGKSGVTAVVMVDERGKNTQAVYYFPASAKNGTRQKESAKSQTLFDPLKSGLAGRKVCRVVEFKRDGVSIALDKSTRMDGSVSEVAVRSELGDLVVTRMRDKGSAVDSVCVYEPKEGVLVGEKVFNEKGSLATSMERLGGPQSTTVQRDYFGPAGRERSVTYFSESQVSLTEYGGDGLPKAAYEYNYSTATAVEYVQGVRAFTRTVRFDKAFLVTVCDQRGEEVCKQVWVPFDPDKLPAEKRGIVNGNYYLSEVEEVGYGTDKHMTWTLRPGGKSVEKVSIRESSGSGNREEKYFSEDGQLEKTVTRPSYFGEYEGYLPPGSETTPSADDAKVLFKDRSELQMKSEYLKLTALTAVKSKEEAKLPARGARRNVRLFFD